MDRFFNLFLLFWWIYWIHIWRRSSWYRQICGFNTQDPIPCLGIGGKTFVDSTLVEVLGLVIPAIGYRFILREIYLIPIYTISDCIILAFWTFIWWISFLSICRWSRRSTAYNHWSITMHMSVFLVPWWSIRVCECSNSSVQWGSLKL